jgi:hypothetical protein
MALRPQEDSTHGPFSQPYDVRAIYIRELFHEVELAIFLFSFLSNVC